MAIRPVAEYAVPGEIVFVVGKAYIVRMKRGDLFYLALYMFPAHFQRSIPLLGAPSISEISASYTEDTDLIDVFVQNTQQRLSFYIEDGKLTENSCLGRSGVVVKSGPIVYIQGHRAFSIPNSLPSAYYYDQEKMILYTSSLDRTHIHEYSLFSLGKIFPYGAYYAYTKHIEIYTADQKYAISMQYMPEMLVSMCLRNNQYIDTAFFFGDTIISNNWFKKYPENFSPDKLWCRPNYIYLYSSARKKLSVLNKKLEIEYEIFAEAVYISNEYVFMQKDEKVIVHKVDTFRYAFYLTDLSISDETVCIEKKEDFIYVIEQKSISRKGVPLFCMCILVFDLARSTQTIYAPSFCSTIPLYGAKKYILTQKEGQPMYLTSKIQDISLIQINKEVVLFCLTGNSVLFVFLNILLEVPLSAIQEPFFWTATSVCDGVSVFISAENGSIGFTRKQHMHTEYLFSPLILLTLHGYFPENILFTAYKKMPEFSEGLKKTLFHLLDTDEIEATIDLLDLTKKKCFSVYEEAVSGMIRLLDEKNMAKLYAILDAKALEQFTSAKSLGRMLLQDFSLFEGFLDACTKEDKEYMIIDVVEFFSGLNLLDLHESMLCLLVQRNMLYAAGLLLSSRASKCIVAESKTPRELSAAVQSEPADDTEIHIEQKEIEARSCLIDVFRETKKSIAHIQSSSNPAEEIESIFKFSTNSLFIGMLSEQLLALRHRL